MPYEYSRKIRPNEALVAVSGAEGEVALYPRLYERLTLTAERFGFTLSLNDVRCNDKHSKWLVRHIILLAPIESFAEIARRGTNLLRDFDSVSIAFTYGQTDPLIYKNAIERFKRQTADRINFLRPVETGPRRWQIPIEKILDNAVCDTVRVKYDPVLLDSASRSVPKSIASFFREMSGLYRHFSLFHRSASDGYFAIRAQDGGFFITATKTNKSDLAPSRIVRVHSYDVTKNQLVYSGAYLPSSDSVEAAIVFDALPDVNAIVHTHASVAFTRNPRFRERVCVPMLPYGEESLGEALVGGLNLVKDGFVIMEDHGEVFAQKDQIAVAESIKFWCAASESTHEELFDCRS